MRSAKLRGNGPTLILDKTGGVQGQVLVVDRGGYEFAGPRSIAPMVVRAKAGRRVSY
jgi:hypothetical protein